MAIYELRRYKINEGCMAAWLKVMEGEIIPFQVSKGVVVSASFCDMEDETAYFWIRRFADEESMKAIYAAVYESDHWKNEIAPKTAKLMDRNAMQIRRLSPTEMSVLQ